ncbi:MAG TPA: hypothetical protein VFG68_09060 [Fimbriiglobus sp.]|nr:hypothetical protein [Fimbriiglobus sp.]
MSIVVVDETLTARLERAYGSVKLCSPDGRVLGVFVATKPTPADLDPGITEDEIQRRLTDPTVKWYTAAEVEAKLREWGCSK